MQQVVNQFQSGDNFSYVLQCPLTKESIIIDPFEDVSTLIKTAGPKLNTILITHGHPDHVAGVAKILRLTPVTIAVWAHKLEIDDIAPWVQNIHILRGGETLAIGTLKIHVIHTPGHSPGSVCYLYKNNLFTGDTLFVDYVGRSDLPGGNDEELHHSLQERIKTLPASTMVWPGHHYSDNPALTSSTLGRERKENRFLMAGSIEEFRALL